MYIRKTDEKDLSRVMEIYAFARAYMEAHGNPNQWGPTNWPPEDLIREDIRLGHSYVCVDEGKIIGVFYFDQGKDIESTYRIIKDGSWMNDDAYGVVHRIAGDGSRKGIGSFCINWAYDQCGHLRIDTHPDNKVMQQLLKKLGFDRRGIIFVEEDDYPRYAYELCGCDPHMIKTPDIL